MTCSCMEPNDDHGDERHITPQDLECAAQAANISLDQAAQNIMDCCRMASSSQGAQEQMGASPGSNA